MTERKEKEDYSNTILCGDALDVLKSLPDGLVQCCITSPPYFRKRDYEVEGQIGLEETPAAFIEKLAAIFHEVKRVLRPDGTCWINIGDTYSNEKKWGGKTDGKHVSALHTSFPRAKRYTGLGSKNLIGIPWRLAFALQDDDWILRQEIIWNKPNPLPEPVDDRPSCAHEQIFLLAKSEHYYYNGDAIREPLKPKTLTTYGTKHHPLGNDRSGTVKSDNWQRSMHWRQPRLNEDGEPAGANKKSVWTVGSQQYDGEHHATFSPKLIEPCVLAGTRPGDLILDPFMGAGTTALVALRYHRQYLGIELNPKSITEAEERIAIVQTGLWCFPEEEVS